MKNQLNDVAILQVIDAEPGQAAVGDVKKVSAGEGSAQQVA